MPADLQQWLALAIVVVVAALALWRWWIKRRARACGDCATSACGAGRPQPADDDVRVLARPEVKFTRRAADD